MLNEKQFRFSGAYLFDMFLWDEFLGGDTVGCLGEHSIATK